MTATRGEFDFIRISDNHIGFNKPANSGDTGTLKATIDKDQAQLSGRRSGDERGRAAFQTPVRTSSAIWSTTPKAMTTDYEKTGVSLGRRWGVVLAGGDGSRLRGLSRQIAGDERPKQFCDMLGSGSTLLQNTARRVGRNISQDQIAYVVTRAHERYYKPLLEGVHSENVFEQPINRGTGVAILLSILKVMRFDPSAIVGIFPSDHHFSDEAVYLKYVEFMFNGAEYLPERVVLLGIRADRPETEYGWIEPARSGILPVDGSLCPVKRFWEKPPLDIAENLMKQKCVWNSLVMVGTARAFLELIRKGNPALVASVKLPTTSDPEYRTLSSVYHEVPSVDFSGAILACCPDQLSVVSANHLGWSDLGSAERVLETAELLRSLS
jgi:mannose-1-phosphate guanylyltransferase